MADWQQALAVTTMEDQQLFRASLHRAEFSSAKLWCLLSLPFECVTCGGGWVLVLQYGLKLALGPLRRYRSRSTITCVLPRATCFIKYKA